MLDSTRQKGLSIIEIMIALLLGSILIAGLVQIFSSNSQTFRSNEVSSRSQEAGRIASDILSRALRNAGYFGCMPIIGIKNNLDASNAGFQTYLHEFGINNAASENSPVGMEEYPGIRADAAVRPATALATTDHLMVTGARNFGTTITVTSASTNSTTFNISDDGGMQAGDVAMISDCANADIFQVTGVSAVGGASTDFTVTAAPQSGTGFGNDFSLNSPPSCTAGNPCFSVVYSAGAHVVQPYNEVFFIGTGTSGEPALFLRDSTGTDLELVEGVIDMQLRLGEGNGTFDSGVQNWREPGAVVTWSNVIAAQVSILVRAGQADSVDAQQTYCFPGWRDCTDPANLDTAPDRRFYRVYTFTTTLRNRI
ncbi:PilW family protein [Marinobacter sp. BGYM27]|uniref:PilW family protein n=1 Tax=Marinobacter sp. BGYM27 TaxID=2975597 RepID=UPI0021A5B048|nr:PilW family protein [Marinobacter sp. BGYM27]MDG5500677.1 PilW family protein [Marinobacter sp. BGYM27]